jgi:hypothetical protein
MIPLLIAMTMALAGFVGPQIAHACGVKLTGQNVSGPTRSAHPTKVHLMTTISELRELKRGLVRAGHEVETFTRPSELSGDEKVVLTSQDDLSKVKSMCGGSLVLPVRPTVQATVQRLEKGLKRRAQRLAQQEEQD